MPEPHAPSDLKVRIVINKSGSDSKTDEYHYHWGRIIGAFAVLVLAALLIAWLLTDQTTKPLPTTQTKLQSSAGNSNPPADSPAEEASSATAAAAAPEQPGAAVATEATATAAHQGQVIETRQPPAERPVEQVVPTSPPEATQTPVFTQIRTDIHSPVVKRFTLSKAIKNKEPVGDAGSITLDNNNIATVYAFSEVTGMKDEFLHYVWKVDGKEIARVKVGVWNNAWRSYSRKFFNQTMHGDVVVELHHGKNRRLAAISFKY